MNEQFVKYYQGTTETIKGTDAARINRFGVWQADSRDVPWGDQKLPVACKTGEEVLKAAGLDWTVTRQPVYVGTQRLWNKCGLVREYETESGKIEQNVLGIVSAKGYTIVQNRNAMDYLDSLVGTELKYTAAGQVKKGRQVFLVAETEEQWKIGDDPIGGNLLLSTGHDGYHQLRIAITPVRIFCSNCLPHAFKTAKRSWAIKHRNNIFAKIDVAREALGLTKVYFENLQAWGEQLISAKLDKTTIERYIEKLFPKAESKRGNTIRDQKLAAFDACMKADDLANYTGTAWQFINAVSDYETHREQNRESLVGRVLNDNLPLFNAADSMLNALVAA